MLLKKETWSSLLAADSLLGATANMINTIIGGGILSIPFAFKSSGMLAGVLYQAAFGAMTLHGIRLLLISLEYAPVRSYEDLAHAAFGRLGWYAYNIASLANCYGACLGYIIATGDIVPQLMNEMGAPVDRSTLLVLISVFILFPLSVPRDFAALRFVSSLAVVIYAAFVSAIVVLYLGGRDTPPAGPPPALFKLEASGLIRAAPLAAFAFQCITSLFPIYQELRRPTLERMTTVSAASIVIAALLYAATGAAAYAHFGEAVRGDVLLNLADVDSPAMRIVRLGFGLSLCFTYPTLHYAARRSLDQMLFNSSEGDAPTSRLVGETVLIVGSTLALALLVDRVEVVLGFVGAFASTTLLYILPASIFLRLSPATSARDVAFLVVGVSMGVLGFGNQWVETFGAM